MIKQVFLIKKNPAMTFDEFKKHYLEVHAPLVMRSFPEIRKYVVSLALQRGKETAYDAITEIYWDDFETLVKIAKSEVYKNDIVKDEERFMQRDALHVILTEEFPQK